MDNNLKEINHEINAAYEMCIKAGYSHEDVQKFARSILEPVIREHRKHVFFQILKSCIKVAVVFLIIYYLIFYVTTVDNEVNEKIGSTWRIVYRSFLMQALFFWDWTPLYSSPCLVTNPYFGGTELMKADCEDCDHVHQINHVTDLKPDKFVQKYLKKSLPVIVEDATEKWPLMKDTFNVEKVLQWYLEEDSIEEVCKFNSSMKSNSSSEVLTDILNGNSTRFAVYWVNCNKKAVKYWRNFYSRPYFTSDALEFTGDSWVVLSSKFTTKDYEEEKLDLSNLVLFLVQARGFSKIKLIPKKPCNQSCHILEDTLNEGEIMVIPGRMWSLEYYFMEEVDNFLLGLEAFV